MIGFSERDADLTVATPDSGLDGLTVAGDNPIDVDATVDRVLAEATLAPTVAPDLSVKDPAGSRLPVAVHGHARTATIRDRATVAPTSMGGTTTTQPGSFVDFELTRELGRGGMGIVYAARQGSLAREIAVKAVRPEVTNERTERRFMSEALITAELDHPNIVPVYDLARDDNGRLFVGMKLVSGTSWEELLHPGRGKEPTVRPGNTEPEATPEDTLRTVSDGVEVTDAPVKLSAPASTSEKSLRDHLDIFLKVCDAIAYAHARHIVHRDLKPANVMVGMFGEVLVMDWGIALDVSHEPPPQPKTEHKSTATGLGGTPCYMAPEQAKADLASVGPWTDVYLLGAILYEILTGAPPHRGMSLREVLAVACQGHVEPPSQRAPHRKIAPELERITLQALAPSPRDRYTTVNALQAAIRTYLSHEESLRLVDDARSMVDRLASPGEVPRNERYAAYSRTLARLSEALHMWPENDLAANLQSSAAAAWSEEALERGDLDLAWAQSQLIGGAIESLARRKAAIQAAITAQRSRLWRGIAGIVVVVLALALANRALEPAYLRRAAEHNGSALRKELVELASTGLEKARQGKLDELAQTRQKFDRNELMGLPRHRAMSAVLSWTHAVYLWSREAWKELLELLLAPSALKTRVSPGLGKKLIARPELANTYLAGRIARLPSRDQDQLATLWGLVAEAAGAGISPDVLRAACDQLDLVEAPPPEHAHLAGRWGALRRAAVFGLAHAGRIKRHDTADLDAVERGCILFQVHGSPLGHEKSVPATGGQPGWTRGEDDVWTVLDRTTGRPRWESTAMAGLRPFHLAIPTVAGNLILGGQGVLVELDGTNGRVLGRLPLDAQVVTLSPDPLHTDRLLVVTLPDSSVGCARVFSVEGGHITEPLFGPDFLVAAGLARNAAQIVRSTRAAAYTKLRRSPATTVEKSGLSKDDPPEVRRAVLDALDQALTQDPGHPGLLLRRLALRPEIPAGERRTQAERIAATASLLPEQQVHIGVELDKLGFPDIADGLIEKGARGRMARGSNVDMAPSWITSPAAMLRMRGGDLFAQGKPDRALNLAERGRWFSSYLEGDTAFYQQYSQWLEKKGRSAEAAEMTHRAVDSRSQGGLFLMHPAVVFALDVLMMVFVFTPLVMLGLALRLWWRARESSKADLSACGVRTRAQRVVTFLSQPVDRLKCLFLSYATRAERFALVAGGLIYAISFLLVCTGVAAIGEVAGAPLGLVLGDAGAEPMLRTVQDLRQTGGPAPSSERLLAEGWYQRGDVAQSRIHLESLMQLDPSDAFAPNNLGVLAEQAGRTADSRKLYQAAAVLAGPGQAVGAWNLARLDSNRQALEAALKAMTHRDQVAVKLSPNPRALWARCAYEDLEWVALTHKSLFQRATSIILSFLDRAAFASMNNIVSLSSVIGDDSSPLATVSIVGQLSYYLVLGLALLSVIWLPFPVRPLLTDKELDAFAPPPAKPGVFYGNLSILWQVIQPYQEGLATVAGLILPGSWDVLRGRLLVGTTKLLSLVILYSVRTTALGGGILAAIAIPVFNKGYFQASSGLGAMQDTLPLARLVTAGIIALYLLEILQALHRHWRSRAAR